MIRQTSHAASFHVVVVVVVVARPVAGFESRENYEIRAEWEESVGEKCDNLLPAILWRG